MKKILGNKFLLGQFGGGSIIDRLVNLSAQEIEKIILLKDTSNLGISMAIIKRTAGPKLNEELNESTWLIIQNKYPNIFEIDSTTFWKNQLMSIGGEYQIWANAPINPELN